MPKIFLIKNRLHQQQQRLLESQNLLQDKTDDDRLVPPLSPSHNRERDRSTSPPSYHQARLQPFAEAKDFPRSRNASPSPSNIASTSDSLKALHIHNHQQQQQQQKQNLNLARSRSQSPIGDVLDLHKKSPLSCNVTSNVSKLRATEDYEGDEEEQPLSLVSSLTYLGRKRFHQYHRNLRTSAASPTASSTTVATTAPSATTTTTTTIAATEIDKVDSNNADKEKEENNEVGPVTSLCEKDRLSPPVTTATTTTTAASSTEACHSRSSSPAFSPIVDRVATCSSSLKQLQDCPDSFSKAINPKAEDQPQQLKQSLEELNDSPKSASPKHRYISSYKKSLIGGVVLTQAQRKEYPLEIVQKIQKENTTVFAQQQQQLRPIDENSDSDSDSDDGSKLIVDEKPLVPEEQPLSLRVRSSPPPEDKRPSPPPCPEPAVRCSVIQRTPSNLEENQRRRRSHEVFLPLGNLEHLGPEQQEPIDYHVPRRRSTLDNDEEQLLNAKRLERERKLREARRRSALLAARTILAQAKVNPRFIRSLPGILAAAAGHGRTTSGSNGSNQGQGFQNGFGGSNGSGSQQHSSGGGGSPTGFGGSGGLSGGAGGGGMGGGRDGRGNYGPNSPPSGALPPFYESLKSGNTMNGSSTTNFNSSATSNFLQQNAAAYLMSAASNGGGSSGGGGVGQQYNSSSGGDNMGGGGGISSAPNLTGSSSLDQATPSASSMLFANGHAYGIILKDEPDLEEYEEKIDIGAFAQNIIQATMGNSGNFNASAFEDAIMPDLASAAQGPNGAMVDSLQFTANLILSSQTDHLLEQLSNAVDLSSFLQRNCVDDENSTSPRQDFELVSTPSLTPDSVSITPVDCHNSSTLQLDTFHENLMQQLTNNITRTQQTAANYAPYERHQQQQQHQMQQQQHQQQPPPSYQHATRDIMQMQQQHHQHQQNGYQQNQATQPLNSLLNQNNLLMQQQQQHYQQQQQQHGNSYHHMQQQQQSQHSHQQHALSLNQHQLQQQQQQHLPHHHGGHGHHSQLGSNSNGHHPGPHHLMQHHSDNSNLSLPSPNSSSAISTTANGHMMIPSQSHHPMSSAASNTSSGSASAAALLDTSLLDAKPIIQSVSPTNSATSGSSRYCSSSCSSSSSTNSSYKQKRSVTVATASMAAAAAVAASASCLTSPTVAKLHESKVLQQRLGLPPEVQLEFVNGGHGIKNPLAIENSHGHHHHRIRSIDCVDDMKKPLISDTSMNGSIGGNSNSSCSSSNGNGVISGMNNNENNVQEPSNFVCRICLKSFTLKRLLNRHMKCHSEIKRYLCTFCGKGFNDTFDLKRHTRTHTGVRPYKCNLCEKSFTQRCSLESHCLKVHSMQHQYAYKERRTKMYVCEECGHTTCEPEVHYIHLKENHPYSPALLKFYDKRHFKFNNSQFANNLLGQLPMPVHN
uniref:C2H2-type domain-containing protein n=1 Tax=Stomoxys calcitrans TaxID=35570 RepID=A0A1I8P0G9_STOCA